MSEMVRQIASEANLLSDAASHMLSGTTSMATIHDYGNVVVPESGLVIFTFAAFQSIAQNCYIRAEFGGVPITGLMFSDQGVDHTVCGVVWLAAGTYNFKIKGCNVAGTGAIYCKLVQVGFVKLSDAVGSAVAAYSGAIDLTVASRKTPAGDLKQATFAIQVEAYTVAGVTNIEDAAETLTNGVGVSVDAVRANWTVKQQDPDSKQAAHGELFVSLTVGASHAITITKENAATTVNISVSACPWLLGPSLLEPVTLDISQGSTLYLTEEPLFADPTKFIGVGKVRGVTFGSADDYYSTASATGISSFTYTFDSIDQAAGFVCSGLGGCISVVGVDLR